MQFSLKWLFVLVGFAGLTCVALGRPTQIWHEVFFWSSVLLMLFSFLGAISRSGQKRAFWLGFAAFGWTLLLAPGGGFATAPRSNIPKTRQFGLINWSSSQYTDAGSPRLPINWAADSLWQLAFDNVSVDNAFSRGLINSETRQMQLGAGWAPSQPIPGLLINTRQPFVGIFNAAATLLLALFGGLIAQALYLREQRKGKEG